MTINVREKVSKFGHPAQVKVIFVYIYSIQRNKKLIPANAHKIPHNTVLYLPLGYFNKAAGIFHTQHVVHC